MKDEIKEILDDLGNKNSYINDETILTFDEAKDILDYITNLQTIEQQYSAILSENAELENKITNLQKENEILNQNNQAMQEEMARTWKIADDYKSRNEKAIECINYYAIEDDDFNKLYNVEEQELLAILGDKENE